MTSNKKKVVIIDYQLGNLFSVKQACDSVGIKSIISSSVDDINTADALILPGVGAFNEAMKNLNNLNLVKTIKANVKNKIPIFGVCLGLQLLFEESEEFLSSKGLGILSGKIIKFPSIFNNEHIRVPQIAWNQISINKNLKHKSPLMNIKDEDFMYFVHSYYVKPENDDLVLTTTNYENFNYCSSVLNQNIFATQFHPEKSGNEGLKIYKDWASINNLI